MFHLYKKTDWQNGVYLCKFFRCSNNPSALDDINRI